jgi:hypothetical protein
MGTSRGGRIEVCCKTCGLPFMAYRSVIAKHYAKHCSKSCADVSRSGCGNGRWKGGVHITEDGYVMAWAPWHHKAKHNKVLQHVLIAEKALGHKLPPRAVVHHFNEIKGDNRNKNLVICENIRYHSLLHARQRIASRNADPNTQKICFHCDSVKDRTSFYKNRTTGDGLSSHCKACADNIKRSLGSQKEDE